MHRAELERIVHELEREDVRHACALSTGFAPGTEVLFAILVATPVAIAGSIVSNVFLAVAGSVVVALLVRGVRRNLIAVVTDTELLMFAKARLWPRSKRHPVASAQQLTGLDLRIHRESRGSIELLLNGHRRFWAGPEAAQDARRLVELVAAI